MNSEINESADFRRPMLARGIEGIERKQLARPVGKQFDQTSVIDDVFGAELHDLSNAHARLARTQHRADI